MTNSLLHSLAAMISLVPLGLLSLRRDSQAHGLFWILLLAAIAGPASWIITQASDHWQTGLSVTLWIAVTASLCGFAVCAVISPQGRRLAPLLMPYLAALGVIATVWVTVPGKSLAASAPSGWISAHIVLSVLTYALVTVAAISALAAFLQDRALKNKRPTALTRLLPSVIDSERLMVRLLTVGEAILGLGLITGMIVQFQETQAILQLDHKTVLSLAAFVVIGALLIAHSLTGMRGRLVARLVLLSYLLLTLGYPGVKFVTDVLLKVPA